MVSAVDIASVLRPRTARAQARRLLSASAHTLVDDPSVTVVTPVNARAFTASRRPAARELALGGVFHGCILAP